MSIDTGNGGAATGCPCGCGAAEKAHCWKEVGHRSAGRSSTMSEHPLSSATMATLRRLADFGPEPKSEVNPGVVRRLTTCAEPLAEVVDLPSPHKTRPGNVAHLRIAATGRRHRATSN